LFLEKLLLLKSWHIVKNIAEMNLGKANVKGTDEIP
jgi:hypothetical protein